MSAHSRTTELAQSFHDRISAAVDYSKIITTEPGTRSGKPCTRALRITAQDVFEYLDGGMTVNQILEDFAEFNWEFAADRERKF